MEPVNWNHLPAIVSTVFVAIAWFTTLLRCYTRIAVIGGFQMDDVCSVLGTIASTCLTTMVWFEDKHGLGRDISTVATEDLILFLKAFWVFVICFCLGIVFVKCSAILQCLRFILVGKLRWFCWFLLVIFPAMGLSAILLQVFSCTPISASWEITLPNRRCLDFKYLWYIGSGVITMTDIIVVAIPLYTVKSLKIPRRQKIALIVVFAMGGLACIASVIRFYASVVLGTNSDNFTIHGCASALWAPIELNIGIICINIPPLKPLAIRVAPVLLGDKSKSSSVAASNLSGQTLTGSHFHLHGTTPDIELAYPELGKLADH